jgi:ATP-dependent helicase/nuclease subunit A
MVAGGRRGDWRVTKIVIPAHLREAQLAASDPRSSIWVSANAGSGKTHVLTQRVIRLLLQGVPPAKILCLTFTKAAAAQMSTRVFDVLAKWTNLDDEALRTAVMETGAPSPNPAQLLLARRLFTRTVETPGGLKIQTIHAFCERLLHLFPFEANVPARFEVADDLRQAMLLAQAKASAIGTAHRAGGALGEALARLAGEVSSAGLDKLISEAMELRKPALRWSLTDPQDALASKLGASGTATAEGIERDMLEGGFAPAEWPDLAAFFESGSANDVKLGAKFRRARELLESNSRDDALAAYCSAFFTKDGEQTKRLMTKGLAAQRPVLAEDMQEEQARLSYLIDQLKAVRTIERTKALMMITDAALHEYEQRKILSGVLDFDDLIERTRALLGRAGSGWVLHKLDNGIDHVLVDEAQDTSEAQWRILDGLTGDFASGHGSRAQDRSFFAVGDDKQSIFSFQGAAPHKFHDMRRRFAKRFEAGAKPFDHIRLQTSFRSVPAVLAAVDRVFEIKAHQGGLVPQDDIWPMHESFKAQLPGLVEVWPPLGRQPGAEPIDWRLPVDAPDEQDPVAVLASRIARKIAALIAPGSPDFVHDGRGNSARPVRPGDVLILVRRRNAFFEAIIRALKQAGVPVAGADRLDIANHIAVLDLTAAGRAALLPQDDLTLASLLKSPLFDFTDEDLTEIAPNREGSLMAALGASDVARYRRAYDTVLLWGRHAAEETPFAFYAALLGRDGGRRKMEARLGLEAHDAIDEFLRLALMHERETAPSLGSFLDDIEALQTSIKRDMEGPGDAVRVMTVHAAKGLEAKIVFVPDTCGVPSLQHEPVIFNLEQDEERPPILAWSPRKDGDCPAITAEREAEREATMEEYRRLLYVALTRAEERLYISGFHGVRAPDEKCWAKMIAAAFADDSGIRHIPAPWDENEMVLQRLTPGSTGTTVVSAPVAAAPEPEETVPDWLFRPAKLDHTTGTPLRPSSAPDSAPRQGRSGLAYGAAIHELLQYLPDLPESQRETAALAYLEAATSLEAPAQRSIAAQALAVVALPALAPLFAAGSRAEAAIMAVVTRPDGSVWQIPGKVDRLAVDGDNVLVADFKSGSPPGAGGTPKAYIRQLALYRLALTPLWPGKHLRMLLIWTGGPVVQEFDDTVLDQAAAEAIDAPGF